MNAHVANILIIEDDQFLRELYEELLTEEGYLIDSTSNGEEGVRALKEKNYDLILLDIMLPKMDGISVLERLSDQDKRRQGPIILLTNLGQDEVIKKCFTLGAKGFLIKSALTPEQVLSEVGTILGKHP